MSDLPFETSLGRDIPQPPDHLMSLDSDFTPFRLGGAARSFTCIYDTNYTIYPSIACLKFLAS